MKFSLKIKMILIIVCIVTGISVLAIVIYDKGIHDVIETQYEDRSVDIARLVAVEIDSEKLESVQKAVREIYDQADNKVMSDQWGTPEFEEYVSRFESIREMDDYQALLAQLQEMQDEVDVDCLYITWLDVENECNVYLVDAAHEDACPIGCIDPIYTEDRTVLEHPEIGFAPNISNTPEYGWLIATGMPVFNDQGELIAISAVDISMNEIIAKQQHFLITVALLFLCLTILLCLVAIILVNHIIIKPVNVLTRAVEQYSHNNKKAFSELDISKNDEIGILAASMANMEEEINGYISNLEQTTSDLIRAREHAEQMDIAANIDALTKIRNKRAYDIDAARLNESTKPYGIAMIDLNGLKEINDSYGHEKGNISINTVCQIICRIFKHSPVYRVGGDEFVVVLENNDFENRESLIRAFSDEIRKNASDESLEAWQRVTAAVGCAVYDPEEDENVESVLKRADAAMYVNKKAMKASEQ